MFIHDAILESRSVTCGDTQISATSLRANITKMKNRDNKNQPHGFKYQFQVCFSTIWYRIVTLIYPYITLADFGAGFSQS